MYSQYCVFQYLFIFTGGGLFGILGSYTNRWGRDYIVLIGFVFHMIVYLCVFFYFPEKSISGDIAKDDSHGALGIYGVMAK